MKLLSLYCMLHEVSHVLLLKQTKTIDQTKHLAHGNTAFGLLMSECYEKPLLLYAAETCGKSADKFTHPEQAVTNRSKGFKEV